MSIARDHQPAGATGRVAKQQMIMTSSYKVVETRLCCNMMSPLFFVCLFGSYGTVCTGAPHEKLDAVDPLQMHFAVMFGSQQVVAPSTHV